MTRLMFVAAALAAGMTAFAANAQEGPDPTASHKLTAIPAKAVGEAEKAKDTKPEKAEPKATKVDQPKAKPVQPKTKIASAAKAATPKKEKKAGRTKIDIDPVKTAAVTKAAKPDVVFKARKSVKGAAPAGSSSKAVASAGAYGSIVSRYAAEYGIPASLAHAVITVESNYRPDARGSAGEIGLMQIKPATARGLGYRGSAQGLFDPDTNIRYGMLYLAKAHQLAGGNTCGTILRYNAGHGARRMNPVSAAYCSKVKRHLGA